MNVLTEEEIYKKKNTVKRNYIFGTPSFSEKCIVIDSDMKMFELNDELKAANEKKTLLETEITLLKKQNIKLLKSYTDKLHKDKETIITLKTNYNNLLKENKSLKCNVVENEQLKIKNENLKDTSDELNKQYNELHMQYKNLENQYNDEIIKNNILTRKNKKLKDTIDDIVANKSEIIELIDEIYSTRL